MRGVVMRAPGDVRVDQTAWIHEDVLGTTRAAQAEQIQVPLADGILVAAPDNVRIHGRTCSRTPVPAPQAFEAPLRP